MMKHSAFLLSILLFVSCGHPAKNNPASSITTKADSASFSTINDTMPDAPEWCDALTNEYLKYLEHTHNPMIRDGETDTVINIKWMFDGMDKEDSANYYMMRLGYDIGDSIDGRFLTIGWFYIDSATKKTFEYSSIDDTLRLLNLNKKYAPGELQPDRYIVNGSNENKVYFHNAPDSLTKRKAFFNSKQKVYVSTIENGYGFVEFYNTKSQRSTGWIEIKNLLPYSDSLK
jgi:hypothetical protein